MTILERLRVATRELHNQVAATPYSQALATGEAVLESYVSAGRTGPATDL